MRFDLGSFPPPVRVSVGSESFELLSRWWTSTERAACVEALNRGLAAACELVFESIQDWRGVQDANGMPMPIHREDERGNKLSNLPQVMGRVPWLEQVKAMLGLFAVNGVQFKRARDLLSDMVSDASGLEEIERTLDSLFQQAGGGPKNSAAS